MRNHYSILLAAIVLAVNAPAQEMNHENMHHEMADTVENEGMDHSMHGHHEAVKRSLFTPMSMEGSGTSWVPATSPIYGLMFMPGNWMIMLHGAGTLRYTVQGGPRGSAAWSAPNWFMGMAQRSFGERGLLKLRGMLSLDRVVDGGDGYPLLLQTGETWKGVPLIDRQHPHDLFDELSATYTQAFSESFNGFVYLAYPGEPALGPSAFMHRSSAMYNSDAPIGHHWQDATHVTFGVATAGVVIDNIKADASIFTGREPDENRYNFDKPRFDSYSGRVSYNPVDELVVQASYGKLKNPEGDGLDVARSTASVLHTIMIDEDTFLSSSFVWGQNNTAHAGALQSFLLESLAEYEGNAAYCRFESVEKTLEELGIEDGHERKERVSLFTVGANRRIYGNKDLDLRLGIQGTLYGLPSDLTAYYGKNPVSFQMYLSLTPAVLLSH